MKYYCEECRETYDKEELDVLYYSNIEKDILECPECKSDQFNVIIEETVLNIGYQNAGNNKRLLAVEWDPKTGDVFRENDINIQDVFKALKGYMNAIDTVVLECNGVRISIVEE